jgi:hypothetical protein
MHVGGLSLKQVTRQLDKFVDVLNAFKLGPSAAAPASQPTRLQEISTQLGSEMTEIARPLEAPRRATVDDYLGPGENRFFGKGYKRVEQRLTDIHVEPGCVRARASVRYPDDWSRKGTTNQPPHLSSIDTLLIAGEMAELYLTHVLRLDARARSDVRLRKVRMKAGRDPVEKELGEFVVQATITSQSLRTSVVDCQVGTLRVCCEIEHPESSPAPEPGHYHGPDELLGPAELRPFAAAHRTKTQVIEDLDIDVPGCRARAVLSTRSTARQDLPVQGLESYSHGASSIIDAFVAAVQLGQILLYELDAVSRAESNTLWMRQTVLEIGDPHRPVYTPAGLSVRLEEPRLLTTRDGATWRTADITAEFEHMNICCSATHRLSGMRS